MNNFDEWKQTLTPDDILTNYGIFDFCGTLCPAKGYCYFKGWTEGNHVRIKPTCREIFFEWAGKEATC